MWFFPSYRLSESDELRIQQSIKNAESGTSGEIRIYIGKLKKGEDILEKARLKFEELGMHQTKNRNAILFVYCPVQKSIAVWGDEGIHAVVSQDFWNELVHEIVEGFKTNHGVEALCQAIEKCGLFLKKHFPISSDSQNPNELSDEVHYES